MENWVCSICLCNNKENTVKLEGCEHEFHCECIITSLRINGPKCPNCRGLDSRCQLEQYNYEPEFTNSDDDYTDDLEIDNTFDINSEFDMDIQHMLLNIAEEETTNIDENVFEDENDEINNK